MTSAASSSLDARSTAPPASASDGGAFQGHVDIQSGRIVRRIVAACMVLTVVLAPHDVLLWDSLPRTARLLVAERLCLLSICGAYVASLPFGRRRLSQHARTMLMVVAAAACVGLAGGALATDDAYWYLALQLVPVMTTPIFVPMRQRLALTGLVVAVAQAAFFLSFRGRLASEYVVHTLGLWALATVGAVMGGDELYRLTREAFSLRRSLEGQRARLADQVADAMTEVRRLTAHLDDAVEQERRRLARELHDNLGQDLTGLRLQLAAVEALGEEGGGDGRLQRLGESLEAMHDNVRSILTSLRPRVLERRGLVGGIEWLIDRLASDTCDVVFDARFRERTHPSIELATFRIVQEALSNVRRHAEASEARVVARR